MVFNIKIMRATKEGLEEMRFSSGTRPASTFGICRWQMLGVLKNALMRSCISTNAFAVSIYPENGQEGGTANVGPTSYLKMICAHEVSKYTVSQQKPWHVEGV